MEVIWLETLRVFIVIAKPKTLRTVYREECRGGFNYSSPTRWWFPTGSRQGWLLDFVRKVEFANLPHATTALVKHGRTLRGLRLKLEDD